jgi:hypothetical protein
VAGIAGLRGASALVARLAGPTLLAALMAIAVAEASYRLEPSELPADLESIVIQTQQTRAQTIANADLLVVGDSSGLMDIDAARLASLMGRRVESLSTG